MKTTKALPMSLLTAALMAFAAGASGQEVVPITATLPIKAVGDSCTELNLGTTANPNLIAAEGVAITADRASLLTCQVGVWKKQASNAKVLQETPEQYVGRMTWPGYWNSSWFISCPTFDCSTWAPAYQTWQFAVVDAGGGTYSIARRIFTPATLGGPAWSEWTVLCTTSTNYPFYCNWGGNPVSILSIGIQIGYVTNPGFYFLAVWGS